MGIENKVDMGRWPAQGAFLGRRVDVCFLYDHDIMMPGIIVRDDETGVTIIKLDDGRYVLGTECQYSLL